VRQAVSWARAAKTGVWTWTQETAPATEQEPDFDFELIDNLVRFIGECERGWARFFKACDVAPLKVTYEEVVHDYEGTALRVLDFLGVPYPQDLSFGERRMVRQSDGLNEKWLRMYREMKRA
jgi:LPS sulfotransferase NodH